MRLHVHHSMRYSFSQPQARLIQLLRLTPASYEGQNVLQWRIDACRDARLRRSHDGYGNLVTMLYVDGPLTELTLTVSGMAITEDRAGMVGSAPDPLPPAFFLQPTALTAPSAAIAALADEVAAASEDPLDRAHGLMAAIHARLALVTDPTVGDVGAAAAIAAEAANPRDMAHLFAAAARRIGLPTRYVSGLMATEGETVHAAHGWAEAHVDGYGWIGFDPSADRCPDARYVRVAVGLDHGEAAPVSGQRVGGGDEHLAVNVRVGADAAMVQAQG
ncbi:MAG: transglutaminase family protein [Sphingomonas fennica]